MESTQTARPSQPQVVPSFQVVPVAELLAVARDWSRGHAHHRMPGIPQSAPGRLSFGPLRLFAFETVAAGHGYALHGHANVEVVTLILDGTVLHRDSVGGETELSSEVVAVMSAGRGIQHAEYAGADRAARVIQIQLESRSRDVTPRAEHAVMPRSARRGCLRVLASGRASDAGTGALWIDQDASLSSVMLAAGMRAEHRVERGRLAYLMPVDASIAVYGHVVRAGERILVRSAGVIALEARGATEVVVLDAGADL